MISGLVIHLGSDESLVDTAVTAMRDYSAIELGDCVGSRLPAVVEAKDGGTAEELTDWLRRLSGVTHVDVAYVHLED